MKLIHGWIMCAMVGALATGCASSYHEAGAERVTRGNYLFTATGVALVAEPGDESDLIKAQMAAEAIARANLLKNVKGAYVTDKVTVEDLMFVDHRAQQETAGWLSRAEMTLVRDPRRMDDKVVEVRADLVVTRRDLQNMRRFAE